MTDGQTDGGDCNIPIAFFKNERMDRWMDRGNCNIPIAFFKIMSHVLAQIEFWVGKCVLGK